MRYRLSILVGYSPLEIIAKGQEKVRSHGEQMADLYICSYDLIHALGLVNVTMVDLTIKPHNRIMVIVLFNTRHSARP